MLRIKVVLDVNILISAIFSFTGGAHKIVDFALDKKIKIYTSLEILKELEEKLRDKFKQDESFIERQVSLILNYAELIEPKLELNIIEKDPDDNKFLECALESDADFIITRDHHLLDLKNYENILIVDPAEFLEIFRNKFN